MRHILGTQMVEMVSNFEINHTVLFQSWSTIDTKYVFPIHLIVSWKPDISLQWSFDSHPSEEYIYPFKYIPPTIKYSWQVGVGVGRELTAQVRGLYLQHFYFEREKRYKTGNLLKLKNYFLPIFWKRNDNSKCSFQATQTPRLWCFFLSMEQQIHTIFRQRHISKRANGWYM